MQNYLNQQVYQNCRNSTNWIDFYNNLNNNTIYIDSDNESLETLDSDSESESNNNTNLLNNESRNLINIVINEVNMNHIRRPIIINNQRRSQNYEYRDISLQNIIDESFEESNSIDSNNISKNDHVEKLKNLKKIKLEEDADCIICMEKIQKNKNVYQINCNHKFHKHCLSNWLKEKFECPVCRHEI